MLDYEPLRQAVINGKRHDATRLTQEALDAGATPMEIVDEGLVPGMAVVGEKFKCNELYVSQMLIAARAMKESMAVLEPLLAKEGIKPAHTIILGTVEGDLHDIGKSLVGMMLKGANYGIVDLGTNVPTTTFVDAVKEHDADVVGLSALLTTTMSEMKTTIEAMREAGLSEVKVIIGGAPITQDYADQIGADGFAPDAATAVDVVKDMLKAAP